MDEKINSRAVDQAFAYLLGLTRTLHSRTISQDRAERIVEAMRNIFNADFIVLYESDSGSNHDYVLSGIISARPKTEVIVKKYYNRLSANSRIVARSIN